MKKVLLTAALLTCAGVAVTVVLANRRADPLPPGTTADEIVIKKSDRSLSLMKGGHVLRTYRVALGPSPVGPKQREGDGQTPEGSYVVDFHKTDSAFHLALHISYPTPNQRKAAAARGVRPGGDIMIHGIRNGLGFVGRLHALADWTQGCIAVTDPEIEEIMRVVPDGTRVKILP